MSKKPSDYFRELADKIDKNAPEDFGGAFLIMPPGVGGENMSDPVSGFFVGSADPAPFFMIVKSKLEVLLNEIDQKMQQQKVMYSR